MEYVSLFVLDEVTVAGSVRIAHDHRLVLLHDKVFAAVARVECPSCCECLEGPICTSLNHILQKVSPVTLRDRVAIRVEVVNLSHFIFPPPDDHISSSHVFSEPNRQIRLVRNGHLHHDFLCCLVDIGVPLETITPAFAHLI